MNTEQSQDSTPPAERWRSHGPLDPHPIPVHATDTVNEKGCHGTSVRDLDGRVGVTTPIPTDAERSVLTTCRGVANRFRKDGPLTAEEVAEHHVLPALGTVGHPARPPTPLRARSRGAPPPRGPPPPGPPPPGPPLRGVPPGAPPGDAAGHRAPAGLRRSAAVPAALFDNPAPATS
ncbi:hypothetical protein GCM10010515_06710 [Streptomyces fructofermentans]|uniref:Uncharacterized protein n=1 Tax=Streptomyces fructofermentans TaxID=152141 RepID=A0A918K0Q0_9ACTN|nr:hypothetical protein GCM10010515_06710 [Streptomyces fructofermentans]